MKKNEIKFKSRLRAKNQAKLIDALASGNDKKEPKQRLVFNPPKDPKDE